MIRRQLAAARNVIVVDVPSNCAETWTTYVTRRALTVPARPQAFQFFHSNYRYWCGWQWHVDWLWTSRRTDQLEELRVSALSADRATNSLSVSHTTCNIVWHVIWGGGGVSPPMNIKIKPLPSDFKQTYRYPTFPKRASIRWEWWMLVWWRCVLGVRTGI